MKFTRADIVSILGTLAVVVGIVFTGKYIEQAAEKEKHNLKRTVQQALQEEPVHDLGPLVFLEQYSFHDANLNYKVVRLETGERIFIAYGNQGITCIKIDKR